MAFNADSPEDETDRRIRAEMAATWAEPVKRTRRATPPEFQNQAGRLALSLWREQARFSEAHGRYENWWGVLLDAGSKDRIDAAIAQFDSYEALMAAWLQRRRKAVIFEGTPFVARWDELRERLPQVDFEQFVSLMFRPVAERTAFAEELGKVIARVLKEYLDVPSHRPRVKQSKADLENDKWMRRVAAYILNFPEKCR